MKNTSTFHGLFTRARESVAYAVEGAIISFTEQVVARMKGLNINRSALAGKLESSPAYITKFLGGETNFTLESMVKVAGALDSEIKIKLVPKTSPEAWINLLKQSSPSHVQHTAWRCWRREQVQADDSQIVGLSLYRQEIVKLSY